MQYFLFILIHNILPIFILIVIGFILSRKFELDILTLTKINFYIFVPAFTFSNLYTTKFSFDMAKVFLIAVLIMAMNLILTLIVAKIRKYDVGMQNAFANSTMFYNSGNFAIPLITLIFSNNPFLVDGSTPYLNVALTVQIIILVFQDITGNTIGFFNAGRKNSHWKDSVASILKMPAIYTVPVALLLKLVPYDMTTLFVWPAIMYASNALIAIALVTLGIQLSKTKFEFRNKDVYLSSFIRLVIGPFIAILLIYLFGLTGIIAQTLMISTAVPTAVNTALIAVEMDNHADFSSQAVMTSTVLSAVSLIFVVYMAQILFPI